MNKYIVLFHAVKTISSVLDYKKSQCLHSMSSAGVRNATLVLHFIND